MNGLMTYLDQAKCRDFLRDPEGHFKNTKIFNFDIIHRQVRGEKVPEDLLKKYQTVQENKTKKYPEEPQQNFLASAFRTSRPDIYFEKNVVINHFKGK